MDVEERVLGSEMIPVVRLHSNGDSDSDAGYITPANDTATSTEGSSDGASDAANANAGACEVSDVDGDLKQRVTAQIEFYFSDGNLLKDSFLLKHINRNKQGYVSLKLVASLRKIKSLTKDWQIVLESAKRSNLLQVNRENTKISRKTPPPQIEMSHVNKTLVASHLPAEDLTVAKLEEIFGRYGGIQHVRILQPGKAVPIDVKKYKSLHPAIGKELCAIVEYDTAEAAGTAQRQLDTSQNWRQDMCVQLLGHEVEHPTPSRSEDDKKRAKRFTATTAKQLGDSSNSDGELWLLNRPEKQPQEQQPSKTHRHERARQKKQDHPVKYLLCPETADSVSDSGISCNNSVCSPCPSPDHRSGRLKLSHRPLAVFKSKLDCSSCSTTVTRQPSGPDGSKGFRLLTA